jgi:drug/metabolite transporter (DMT)-like permease
MQWRSIPDKHMQRFRDWLLLIVCNLIWASQFVMIKLVEKDMGFVFAAFLPMTIATIILIPFVLRQRRWRLQRATPMSMRDIGDFVLLGVFGQIAAQLGSTWGTTLSSASNSALLCLTLPIVTSVMAYFFLGERMTWIRLASICLALLGVVGSAGINFKELSIMSRQSLWGNILIFVSIAGSAFYNVYSKNIMKRYSPLEVLLYSYFAVFVFMLPIAIRVEPDGFNRIPHYRFTVWIGLMGLAVFMYALSMVIFLRVLSRIDATQAALMNYLIPFLGVVIAWAVLGEHLTAFMVLGGMLALGSTLLATVFDKPQVTEAID